MEETYLVYRIFKFNKAVSEFVKRIDTRRDIKLFSNPFILEAQVRQNYMIEHNDSGFCLEVHYAETLIKMANHLPDQPPSLDS